MKSKVEWKFIRGKVYVLGRAGRKFFKTFFYHFCHFFCEKYYVDVGAQKEPLLPSDSEAVPATICSMPSCATTAAAASTDPMVLHTAGPGATGGGSQQQPSPAAAAVAAANAGCGGCASCGGNANLSVPTAVSAASKVNGSSVAGNNKTGKTRVRLVRTTSYIVQVPTQ